ncbi:MAG: type I-E CRISPR-associated endoribonuclease Cas2e [bacterium]
MTVIILKRVPTALRGYLTRWLLELKAGAFVGTIPASVRDLLWERCCRSSNGGSCILIQSAQNEQGFVVQFWGCPDRVPLDFDGLTLMCRTKTE